MVLKDGALQACNLPAVLQQRLEVPQQAWLPPAAEMCPYTSLLWGRDYPCNLDSNYNVLQQNCKEAPGASWS